MTTHRDGFLYISLLDNRRITIDITIKIIRKLYKNRLKFMLKNLLIKNKSHKILLDKIILWKTKNKVADKLLKIFKTSQIIITTVIFGIILSLKQMGMTMHWAFNLKDITHYNQK